MSGCPILFLYELGIASLTVISKRNGDAVRVVEEAPTFEWISALNPASQVVFAVNWNLYPLFPGTVVTVVWTCPYFPNKIVFKMGH